MKRTKVVSFITILSLLITISCASFYAETFGGSIKLELIPDEEIIELENDNGDSIAVTGFDHNIEDFAETKTVTESSYLNEHAEIKNQYYSNLCWAYSSTSAMENFLLKKGEYTTALSPLHMAYTILPYSDNTGWANRTYWLNSGGHPYNSQGYITSYGGFRESYLEDLSIINLKNITTTLENNYKKTAKKFDESSEPIVGSYSIALINVSNQNDIKTAIKNYANVNTSFVVSESAFDSEYKNYFCEISGSAIESVDPNAGGHAITIIGWNDNYDKANFSNSKRTVNPKSDGAWICQNSWGTAADNSGLFYISYEDKTLFDSSYGTTWSIIDTHKYSKYETLYEIEKAGAFSSANFFEPKKENTYYLNKFDFNDDEVIQKVNFYTEEVGKSYNIYYVPMASDGAPDNDKNNWTKIGSGTTTYSGFLSADIDNVKTKIGTAFICVEIIDPNKTSSGIGRTTNVKYVDGSYFYKIHNQNTHISYIGYDYYEKVSYKDCSANKDGLGLWYIKVQTTKDIHIGDADFDNEITITDATFIQKCLAHITQATEIQNDCSDVDGDGEVTVTDATCVQKFLAHIDDGSNIGNYVK